MSFFSALNAGATQTVTAGAHAITESALTVAAGATLARNSVRVLESHSETWLMEAQAQAKEAKEAAEQTGKDRALANQANRLGQLRDELEASGNMDLFLALREGKDIKSLSDEIFSRPTPLSVAAE